MPPERQQETLETEQPSEWPKIEAWRLHVLIEAEYPIHLAEKIAARADVDLHRAIELVGQGCTPETAAAILL